MAVCEAAPLTIDATQTGSRLATPNVFDEKAPPTFNAPDDLTLVNTVPAWSCHSCRLAVWEVAPLIINGFTEAELAVIVDSNAAVAYLAYTGSTYGWAVN